MQPRYTEILERALGQISQANEELRQLRKQLTIGRRKAGLVYGVCFLDEFARFDTVVRACQRAIVIRVRGAASGQSRLPKSVLPGSRAFAIGAIMRGSSK